MQNCVCANCAPDFDLGGECVRLPAGGRIDRHVGGADEERGLAADLAPGGQRTVVAQAPRGFDQRSGIDVEHRLGVGLIAGLGIVAGEQQKVTDAERGGAHQVALEREAVSVAAGELQDRLDAHAA